MTDIYDYPEIYDIAYGFRDIPAEVELFEECFRRYGKVPFNTVLEFGSGNAPHMLELARRGRYYIGLESNPRMTAYARKKIAEAGIEAEIVEGDMVKFDLGRQVDFACTFLDSLFVRARSELDSHFDSVAHTVRSGGLYLMDWCVHYENLLETDEGISWEMERNGVKVKTTVKWKAVDRVEQLIEETISYEVEGGDGEGTYSGSVVKSVIYPQEFLLYIASRPDWEFMGWWNNWNLDDPLLHQTKIDRPIALLRRV